MVTQNRVDHNTLRIEGFYQEEENSLDVVLIGASDVYTGYSPAYAYEKYGFTSYSYAIEGNYTGLFINQIKEVLSRQKPKCILIEATGYGNPLSDKDKEVSLATMRKWTDVIPLSLTKINTINENVESDYLSYYFPFIIYHGRPSSLNETKIRYSQLFRGYPYLKGITSTNQKVLSNKIIDVSNDDKTEKINENDERILLDLMDYCKSLDCKVVFARFPHRITNDTQYHQFKTQNYIKSLANKNGFDFINFDKCFEKIKLLPNNDFYDDSHMNVYGQKKMTEYLGNILQNKYGVKKTNLSDINKAKWETAVKYTELFYKYYMLHENDSEINWWYEEPDLIKELEKLI